MSPLSETSFESSLAEYADIENDIRTSLEKLLDEQEHFMVISNFVLILYVGPNVHIEHLLYFGRLCAMQKRLHSRWPRNNVKSATTPRCVP